MALKFAGQDSTGADILAPGNDPKEVVQYYMNMGYPQALAIGLAYPNDPNAQAAYQSFVASGDTSYMHPDTGGFLSAAKDALPGTLAVLGAGMGAGALMGVPAAGGAAVSGSTAGWGDLGAWEAGMSGGAPAGATGGAGALAGTEYAGLDALVPSATTGGAVSPGYNAYDGADALDASLYNGTPTPVGSGPLGNAYGPGATSWLDAIGGPGTAAKAAAVPGMLDRLLNGAATTADYVKLGLGAAGIAALASSKPDLTTTTKVEYPDWYNTGSKSALAQADQFAALGPNSVAPLSANETAAGNLASTSAGNWQPMVDQSNTLATKAAGGIPSVDLSAYMNPYLDNVLTPIARRNAIDKASTLNDINAKAGMRGAFGGSRNDLLTNLASESADRNLNEAEANIRSGAFTTGLTAAQNDLNRMGLSSGQFSKNAATTGALTGSDIGNLSTTGGTARGVTQAGLNAPLTAISGYANALRGNPGSTTTAVAPAPSVVGQATGALTALAGANKAGWL